MYFDEDSAHRNALIVEHNWKTATFNNEAGISAIFSPGSPRQSLDLSSASTLRGFIGLVWLGVLHIWIGIDHIFFLLALILPSVLTRKEGVWEPVGDFRSALINIVTIVTFFTIAHSVTLAMAGLGLVDLPSALVESIIAASIDWTTFTEERGAGNSEATIVIEGVDVILLDRMPSVRPPLTTAETASVFGEMLVFKRLMQDEPDEANRLAMLMGKIDDTIATVFRQVAMTRFEEKLHEARRGEGELATERINEIWMEANRPMFEDSVHLGDHYAYWWMYIPHFVHSPFYCYAYAFGDCLVNSLYAVYVEAREGFAERYLDLLSAGGSKRHRELLGPFGLDASDPDFWRRGLTLIERFIDGNQAAMAEDHQGAPVFMARNAWHLERAQKDHPEIRFQKTRELLH